MNEFISEDERKAEEEASRIDGYKKIYSKTHPVPIRQSLNFLTTLGLEAGLISAASIAAVILAGLRTYDAFYSMFVSSNTPSILTWIGSIAAMIAVEGLLMATGLIQGKAHGTNLSTAGTVTAFVISIAAGLVVSLGPIKSAVASLFGASTYILAIATAIGASILTYIGGLVSGNILNKWGQLQSIADKEYQTFITAWNQAMTLDYRRRGARMFGTTVIAQESTPQKITELDTQVSKHVQEWLDEHGVTVFEVGAGQLISPQIIADALNLPDSGSVRTALSRMRRKAQSNTQLGDTQNG